jgi:hypothetical protein
MQTHAKRNTSKRDSTPIQQTGTLSQAATGRGRSRRQQPSVEEPEEEATPKASNSKKTSLRKPGRTSGRRQHSPVPLSSPATPDSSLPPSSPPAPSSPLPALTSSPHIPETSGQTREHFLSARPTQETVKIGPPIGKKKMLLPARKNAVSNLVFSSRRVDFASPYLMELISNRSYILLLYSWADFASSVFLWHCILTDLFRREMINSEEMVGVFQEYRQLTCHGARYVCFFFYRLNANYR